MGPSRGSAPSMLCQNDGSLGPLDLLHERRGIRAKFRERPDIFRRKHLGHGNLRFRQTRERLPSVSPHSRFRFALARATLALPVLSAACLAHPFAMADSAPMSAGRSTTAPPP